MRRFVSLFVLLLVSVPVGLSISGCAKKTTVEYCNASTGAGVQVGQLNNIVLTPKIYGLSLNYGQIGQVNAPSGTDCRNAAVSVSAYTYASRDISIVDVNPATGALCAGSWNRSTNVIPDFTVCTPPATVTPGKYMTYLTATAQGVSSNPIPIYVHPAVTSVVLGSPSTNCANDSATNCCPLSDGSTASSNFYTANSCLSQGVTAQIAARIYSGTAATGNLQNISCQAGHLNFTTQTNGIVNIDQNGVATAEQPGSTIVTAGIANAGSSAGFFSTCAPVSLTLTVPGTTATSITVNQNFTQPLIATAFDQNGHNITGLPLEFVSTTPTTIPASSNGSVTPLFPGGASITAICQPPACNPSPFNQIGFQGNGKPLTSNPIGVTTPGTSSTLLYIASTGSRYLVPVDLTTTTLGNPVQLPYAPNSMIISLDGSTLYMGSATELMVVSATSNGVTREDVTVPGTVLAVSPDGTTVVISDPSRKLIYLETGTGGVSTQFGGIGTHAQWSPDSQTVYITGNDVNGNPQLLVHSAYTGWYNINPTVAPLDVTVTVPSVGAYFAGASTTAVGYCPASTLLTSNGQPTVSNAFYPPADNVNTQTDRVAATANGQHILGVSATSRLLSDLRVTLPTGPCPAPGAGGLQFSTAGNSTPFTNTLLPVITPTAITGILPTSDLGVTSASGGTTTLAAITYTGTGGVLPVYTPSTAATATPGTLVNTPLTGTATAPVAGVWSTDNLTFFAGTSGDNLVHLLTRPNSHATLTDTRTLAPNLPALTGGNATPNLLVQKPRKTT